MTSKLIIGIIILLAVLFIARKLFVFVLLAAIVYFVYQAIIKKRNEPAWYDVTQYF